jgi:hypothetical protein
MINVLESARSIHLRPGTLRTALERLALGTALMAAPLDLLVADSFEGAVSMPSVIVEHDELPSQFGTGGRPGQSEQIMSSPFDESFATASCTDGCTNCGPGGCRCDGDPPGFFQKLCGIHDKTGACWVGRVDALILWRNAPPDRALLDEDTFSPALNANELDSPGAAGPRVSIIRRDKCSGNAIEATYFNVANFNTQRSIDDLDGFDYVLANPGIYGNANFPFTEGTINLGSRIQSFELNRLFGHSRNLRWIAGFRWLEWQENFWLATTDSFTSINDRYATDCINSLYGGQIGADLTIFTLPWLRVDSVVKAGAYYNNAVQQSFYTTDAGNPLGDTLSVRVNESPLSCAFVGEVGMTGVMPITSYLDFRFGYFALWLSGIAQPTQQLSGQQLVTNAPVEGSIADNGGVVVQGLTLGLEGRW